MEINDLDQISNIFFLFFLHYKRLLLTLKRLDFSTNDDTISIPYGTKTQIKILDDIRKLFTKFGLEYSLSKNIEAELESYHKEEENFDFFSENARAIRNNEFEENDRLVQQFDTFQNVLKQKMKRIHSETETA